MSIQPHKKHQKYTSRNFRLGDLQELRQQLSSTSDKINLTKTEGLSGANSLSHRNFTLPEKPQSLNFNIKN